ncbi:hypothetical protein JCM10212_003219 [Sporobolomyces blumeae]
MPSIEEDFSDPDDLPLDASPLPVPSSAVSKGKGPAHLDDDDPDDAFPPLADSAPGPGQIPKAVKIGPMGQLFKVNPDEFQGWDAIYPIYVDTKFPQQDGARRVSKAVGLEWPLAEQMAKACRMLGYETVFEPSKTHPKDWANPGRVRIPLKRDGKPTVQSIPNKRVLLTRICTMLRPHQPVPVPPASLPAIESRLPPNSPAVSLGTLDSAVRGGGPLGMLGNMLGGGGAGGGTAGEIEDREAEEAAAAAAAAAKKKEGPKVIKPKKVHIKRKR